MRVTIVRDGETSSVEVADDLGTVTVAGHSYPVRVVARTATRVELEIAGERVAIDGWPDRYPTPPAPIDVGGERWTVAVETEAPAAAPNVRPPASPATPPTPASPAAAPGKGAAVLPPMPGKIVELRVREGERVRRGQILLVLEAMKMRNEIASPTDGTVRGLAVSVGANVRAREPMLFVDPD
ncbi:MAG: biotin/lipoyl-containing protein [Thermoplasmata archaeon]